MPIPYNRCKDVTVLSLTPHGPEGRENGLWLLELENPGLAKARPGQFAMLRPASWGFDPLWARPLSICRALPDRLVFNFLVAGRGTSALTRLTPGDKVTLWGPLGHGFAVEPGVRTLMLAGGIGIAPFVEYAAVHPTPGQLSLLFGHRPPLSCYPYEDLAQTVGAESFQDRSAEDIPRFVELLEKRMAEHAGALALACGPTPFLRSVKAAAEKYGVRCQISLENRMACGVGACLGCVAETPDGERVQTCTRGPVFWSNEITL
ncbi:MAG: dihydroorotate dehydrogenase electron transfer [Desulfovibrionaceae bacterium]|nr:MAG: dihydroorotate dehydrogenase electron transfer [Desulfovibrionaceae bacterium]